MSDKKLVFVVVAHQPYIRHINILENEQNKDFGPANDILFSAISQTYLPLVNMLHKFELENVNAKFSLVLSPVLCAMLDDEEIQNQYLDFLNRRILLGEKEILRLKDNPELLRNAQLCLQKAKADKIDFEEKYNKKLLKEFAEFSNKGFIEILATAGSYAFLPHYADLPEILNAQVESGIISHKHYFGSAPEGFYLPFMGYANGIEKTLRSYGINYTILDAHGIMFSENGAKNGIFKPVRCDNSLVVFGRDRRTDAEFNDEEKGFVHNPVYKNQNLDVAYELSASELEGFICAENARVNSLYRYYSKEERNNNFYDEEKALNQARSDAREFFESKSQLLNNASTNVEGETSLVCTFDAELLGQNWAEGMDFFEALLRSQGDVSFASGEELIKEQFKLEKVTPYPCAASGTGYGEDLLDSSNCWMIRYTRKMCERMVDLTGRFPDDTGLKARLLTLGAKELLIALGAEWPKMIHSGTLKDYAETRFNESVIAFTTVFDSLGSNVVSTEWLTKLEKQHNLFPWMNYRIFSTKQ